MYICRRIHTRTKRVPLPLMLILMLSLLLLPLATLTSCAGHPLPPSAGAVLTAMLEAAPTHPVGQSYIRVSDDDAPADAIYLRTALFAALYGSTGRDWLGEDATQENITETIPEHVSDGLSAPSASPAVSTEADTLIRDGALFLSYTMHPFEIGIFRCADLDGALTVGALCQTRLENLRTAWADSAYHTLTERAVVHIKGCYVLLIVAEDPDALLTAAAKVLG